MEIVHVVSVLDSSTSQFLFLPWLFLPSHCEILARLQIPLNFHLGLYYLPPLGKLPSILRKLEMEYQRQFVQSAYTSGEETTASLIKLRGVARMQYPDSQDTDLSISAPVFYLDLTFTAAQLYGLVSICQSLSLSYPYLLLSSQFSSITWNFLISSVSPFYHSGADFAYAFFHLCH